MIIGLLGNQNSGKTTLFNQLTGSNQRVGNFPGVTVERKSGALKRHENVDVIDLPGIYSLTPYSDDEIVTLSFLTEKSADVIINIIDVNNVSRGLYLTVQLMELEMPIVVALNMMDEFGSAGGHIHLEKFREMLGVPVVPISAAKGDGISELVREAIAAGEDKTRDWSHDICSGPVHRTAHALATFIQDHAAKAQLPARYVALRLLDGDEGLARRLKLNSNEKETIEHMAEEMEQDTGLDRTAAVIGMRYDFIDQVVEECIHYPTQVKPTFTQKLDRILTNQVFAIPIFIVIFGLIFWQSFGGIGAWLSDLLEGGITQLSDYLRLTLTTAEANPVLTSLLLAGVLAGVGSVLSFLPLILVLFFFLSLLEDSGYMARVAFVMDKPMRKIGLSGESIVPLLMGFGCTVPATMATRTLPSRRDRRLTIFLTPFMSCSAKVPIYGIFAAAFFPGNTALVMSILYLSGVLLAVAISSILKNTAFSGEPIPFILELPSYRFPSFKSIRQNLWDKAKDFLTRAFTIILLTTVIVWVLRTFTFDLRYTEQINESMLARIASFLSPIFAPLGFGNWQAVTALAAGLTAKEAVVGTLAVLMGQSSTSLISWLPSIFTTASAASFLTFTLLYSPCVAAIASARRELGNRRDTVLFVFGQTALAWLISFLVYRVALGFIWASSSFGTWSGVLLIAMAVLLFTLFIILSVRLLQTRSARVK